jgi:hypothetical protein
MPLICGSAQGRPKARRFTIDARPCIDAQMTISSYVKEDVLKLNHLPNSFRRSLDFVVENCGTVTELSQHGQLQQFGLELAFPNSSPFHPVPS